MENDTSDEDDDQRNTEGEREAEKERERERALTRGSNHLLLALPSIISY